MRNCDECGSACPDTISGLCERCEVSADPRRVRVPLSGGHMDVCLSPDASPETIAALQALGEAAIKRMEAPVESLIGKRATIVGYSETGDGDGSPLGFVAHVCLDIEDGPRVFFQATDPKAAWRIVEEPGPVRGQGGGE